jgi:hypothetical protein
MTRDELVELAAKTQYERDRTQDTGSDLDGWDADTVMPWLKDLYRADLGHIVDLVLANTPTEGNR